jgi:hypothetical protein
MGQKGDAGDFPGLICSVRFDNFLKVVKSLGGGIKTYIPAT